MVDNDPIEDDYWGTSPSPTNPMQTPSPVAQQPETSKSKKVLVMSVIFIFLIMVVVAVLVIGRNMFHSKGTDTPEKQSVTTSQVEQAPKAKPAPTIKPKKVVDEPVITKSQQVPSGSKQLSKVDAVQGISSEKPVDLSKETFSELQKSKAMVLNKSVYSKDNVLLFKVDYVLSGTGTKLFSYVPKAVFDSLKVGDIVDLMLRTVSDGSIAVIN